MDQQDWTVRHKPYDLRERLFLFACLIVRVVQFLHTRGLIAQALPVVDESRELVKIVAAIIRKEASK